MTDDRVYVAENTRERERMRAIVQRASEDLARGVPFTSSDAEPEDVDLWPRAPASPLYAVRASHRGEHLDDIGGALE